MPWCNCRGDGAKVGVYVCRGAVGSRSAGDFVWVFFFLYKFPSLLTAPSTSPSVCTTQLGFCFAQNLPGYDFIHFSTNRNFGWLKIEEYFFLIVSYSVLLDKKWVFISVVRRPLFVVDFFPSSLRLFSIGRGKVS